ncbi:MAG: hypothetical protein ACR2F6_19390 [Mycobacteriales bacterium]
MTLFDRYGVGSDQGQGTTAFSRRADFLNGVIGLPQNISANGLNDFSAFIYGGTADGTSLVIWQRSVWDSPFHLMLVLKMGAAVTYAWGPTVDVRSPLPIRVHLPKRQGWVVAQKEATLSYRMSPNGTWTRTGKNAALLPEAATQVRVNATIVTLQS